MLNPDAVANQRFTGPRADYTPPPPSYRRDGSVSTNDVRRAIQSGADSRDAIAKKLGASRSAISKPIEYLRRTGEIIEAGEQITPAKSEARQKATKAVVPAQDARKDGEVSIPTTQPEECSTEQIKPVAHHSLKVGPITAPIPTMGVWTNPNPPETAQGECATEQPVLTGVRGDSLKAVIALQALYDLADESRALMAENVALKQRVTELERDLAAIPEALSAAQRYQEKIAKIQELLHG